MKILTGEQMARLDRLSIERHKISQRQLMERAAEACCGALEEWSQGKKARVAIFCGPGNNGGDGQVMAAILQDRDWKVHRVLISDKYHINYNELKSKLKESDYIVDALFGTGLARPIRGIFKKVIQILNQSKARKLAVDIPSGISGNTGEVLGIAFKADRTVTFEVPKWGQLQPPAWEFVGELKIVSIGLSQKELNKMPAKAEWVDAALVRKFFVPRSPKVHKGTAGRLLVIAGSAPMPGAGYLTALAALRAGAGLVTWAMPEEAFHHIELKHPEVMLHALPSSEGKFDPRGIRALEKLSKNFDALALGPGLGQGQGVLKFLEAVLKKISKPLVLDADGLNLLAKISKRIRLPAKTLLTPHPLEMARLTGRKVEEILKNREAAAKALAKKMKVWLVLKGFRSVMAGPKGEIFINSTGGSNLAVAGSGDVLTGILGSLLAQGLSPRQALPAGVYLHGRAGDLLKNEKGDRGTLASEVAEKVPEAIRELIDKNYDRNPVEQIFSRNS